MNDLTIWTFEVSTTTDKPSIDIGVIASDKTTAFNKMQSLANDIYGEKVHCQYRLKSVIEQRYGF